MQDQGHKDWLRDAAERIRGDLRFAQDQRMCAAFPGSLKERIRADDERAMALFEAAVILLPLMRDALEPFAERAEETASYLVDGIEGLAAFDDQPVTVKVGHLRRARAVLAEVERIAGGIK